MKQHYLAPQWFIIILMMVSTTLISQVGINTTNPSAGSILDVESSDKGILIPRVNIANIATIAPITGGSPAGLLVYNTNTSTGPGYFYWNGGKWVDIEGFDWKLDGNAGTTPGTGSGQNFLGTSDAKDLIVATNGTERFRVMNTGEVVINNSSPLYSGDMFTATATGSEWGINSYSTGTGAAIYGYADSGGTALMGDNNYTTGNGILASGADAPLYSFPSTGYGGVFTGDYGASGISDSNTGTGITGIGQARTSVTIDPNGSGIAASGYTLGIFSYAGQGEVSSSNRGNAAARFVLDSDDNPTTNTGDNGDRATSILAGFDNVTPNGSSSNRDSYFGGYFSGGSESSGTPSYAYVGMRYKTNNDGDGPRFGGQDYKVIGTGSNSTIFRDQNNIPRIMFSPEAPEILFQDFGTGQLIDGEARINIDPILQSGIYVDATHPLKVYVTLEGNCNGVYVTNKSIKGFNVKELQDGTSNAAFSWQIVANRADTKDVSTGRLVSQHVGVRLPEGPGPLLNKPKRSIKLEEENIDKGNTIAGNTPKNRISN